MSESYIGEIRIFGGNFAPQGWAFCDGSLLSIAENDALFNLIGTTYGGDGQTTFALPDLRGRMPVHQGNGAGLSPRTPGQNGGSEAVTLATQQIPAHTHVPMANTTGNSETVGGTFWAGSSTTPQFVPNTQADTTLNAEAIQANGHNQPHENMPPFLAINFIISLSGIYPSPN